MGKRKSFQSPISFKVCIIMKWKPLVLIYRLLSFLFFFLRGIFCIHPSFRVIGLAEPPLIGSSQQQWLNSELLSMFLFHHVSPLSKQEEAQVVYEMVRISFQLKRLTIQVLFKLDICNLKHVFISNKILCTQGRQQTFTQVKISYL